MLPFLATLAFTQRYTVPDAEWEKMFQAPYKTAKDAEAAWAPIVAIVAKQVENLPDNPTQEELYKQTGMLAPAGYTGYPRISAFTLPALIKGGGKSVLFSVIASLRPSDGTAQRTRNAHILVTQQGRKSVGQLITSGLLLKGGRFDEASGYRQGDWLVIAGCDWNVRLDAGYGPPTAGFFKLKKGRWSPVASYRGSTMSGIAQAKRGRTRPEAVATLMTNKGESIYIYHEASDNQFVETWSLKGSKVAVGQRTQVQTGFWALDSFVTALKKGNRKQAITYLTKPDIFTEDDLALIEKQKEKLSVGAASSEGASGLMFSISTSETTVKSFLVTFKTRGEKTLIDGVIRY